MVLEVLVLLSLAAAACAQCGMNSPCKPLRGGNQPYQLPEQIKSTAGYLSTSLTVDINEYTLDWLTVQRRLYNGMFTGPTIRVRPGDRLDLKLINNLAVADDPTSDEMNIFQFPNTTNLHTHGLHISSKDPQDNPFVRVPAGGAHQYRYEIDPDQPAGTYWYHPHRHGSVHFQLLGGMAGMLVVEDDPNDGELSAVSCPNNCEHEVQVTFQLLSYSDDDDAAFSLVQKEIGDYDGFRLNKHRLDDTSQYENLEQWAEDPDNAMRYMLVNGQLQPTMDLAVGQMKRFRFVNAGGVHGLALHISSGACRVREIAVDGVYLPRPRRAGRSFLVTGGRLDWLVICDRAGTYELRSDFIVDDGYDVTSLGDHPMYNGPLMTLNVAGGKFPRRLPNLPHFLSDLQNIREERIAGRFGIEVTPTDSMNREDFSMNHRYKAEVGTIQEWHFTNTEFESSHPIHTHVNHMQVISYNPYTGPVGVDDGEGNWKFFAQDGESCYYQHPKYNNSHRIEFPHEALAHMRHDVASKQKPSSIGYAKVGEWRDTLLVPPLANITVRFRADKYTGNVVTHCHLTNDEDKGMMMLTEIVPKGRATAVRESYDVRGPRHARTSYGGKSGSCQ